MGGDGGSLMDRRDCIPQCSDPRAKPRKMDNSTTAKHIWTTCRRSGEPLRSPIVACDLGFLYNKDSVLEALLAKAGESPYTQHIKSFKDVTEIHLHPNVSKADMEADLTGQSLEALLDRWQCPVLEDITTNAVHRFVYHRVCGHVVSETALQRVAQRGEPRKCLVCGLASTTIEQYDGTCKNVVMPIAGVTEAEQQRLREFSARRKQLERKHRKASNAPDVELTTAEIPATLLASTGITAPAKKRDVTDEPDEKRRKLVPSKLAG
eukprot:TRINITY_DN30120_c0_g1_i1.p1 TRINITY_DN30120_c0_g1~~TRINITY_DN30120_c0_g1_i1.p1  ORF type:complete len:265 (+),score=57.42 TRINITY_DN30120_c0_g1_i1:27-821(+)